MFELNPSANTNNLRKLAILKCPPICLVDLFCEPNKTNDYKISGMYIFSNEKGQVFTIYDWKETTLYWGQDNGTPTPKKFWHSEKPQLLNIGGQPGTNPKPFIKWFIKIYENYQKNIEQQIDPID